MSRGSQLLDKHVLNTTHGSFYATSRRDEDLPIVREFSYCLRGTRTSYTKSVPWFTKHVRTLLFPIFWPELPYRVKIRNIRHGKTEGSARTPSRLPVPDSLRQSEVRVPWYLLSLYRCRIYLFCHVTNSLLITRLQSHYCWCFICTFHHSLWTVLTENNFQLGVHVKKNVRWLHKNNIRRNHRSFLSYTTH